MTAIASPERLAAVRRTALLDSPPHPALDRLTRLAATILETPVVLVALIDEDRQFFASAVGLPEPFATVRETPLSHAICRHEVESGKPLVIEDARTHPRVQDNGAVRDLGVVAYAGVPLVTDDGHVVGSLCVIDRQPRAWSPRDVEILTSLAASAATEITLRQHIEERAAAGAALRESEDRFRGAFAFASIGMTLTTFDGRFELVNPALCRILGYSEAELLGRSFQLISHPDELPQTLALLDELLAGARAAYQMEKRYLHRDGHAVWVLVDVTVSRSADGRPRHLIAQVQDISLRKRFEEELHRQALVFETISDGVLLMDPEGRITDCNPATERLFGYTKPELLGQSPRLLHHPDVRDGLSPRVHETLVREGRWKGELPFVRKDGSAGMAEMIIVWQRDGDGRSLGMISTYRDITERKRSEDRLRTAHERLATLVGDAPLAILTLELDQHFTVRSWNPAAERLFGWRAEEIVGQPYPLVAPDRMEESIALNRTLFRGGKIFGVETRRQRRDGTQLDVFFLSTVLPPTGEGPQQAVVFFVDMSEQKRAEVERRAANELLRSVVDLAPQAIIAVDLEWRVTRWNAAAERVFQWTAEEMLGRPLPYIPAESMNEFRSRQTSDGQARGATGFEAQRLRKDGTRVDVLVSTGVLQDERGQPTGYIAVLTDLTEYKALEAQLRQAQKMEAVGQLAGGVAHDFNNLLTVIKAHTAFALDGVQPGDAIRVDLEAVSQAANRAAALTRQLLAFSRKQLLKPQVLDLNTTVRGVLPMLERLIGEDIEVVTELEPSLGRVTADPAQLEQVLVNLAVNARDAMPSGGVLIIETANVELDETAAAQHGAAVPPGPYVLLAVGDTGCGMDADTQARIFEPFFTTKEQGRGTGLGLSMVYGIVKQSGGYIWVYSEPGYGTRFRIYLPRSGTGVDAPERAPEATRLRGGSETVLVVEDEAALRSIVQRCLERQGYTVHLAADGTEALELVRAHGGAIDLVVTDVVLPEMGGPVLAERIAADVPAVKILFMTGYTDDDVIRRGLLQPGMALLGKPFTLDELGRAVRRVLDEPTSDLLPIAAPHDTE